VRDIDDLVQSVVSASHVSQPHRVDNDATRLHTDESYGFLSACAPDIFSSVEDISDSLTALGESNELDLTGSVSDNIVNTPEPVEMTNFGNTTVGNDPSYPTGHEYGTSTMNPAQLYLDTLDRSLLAQWPSTDFHSRSRLASTPNASQQATTPRKRRKYNKPSDFSTPSCETEVANTVTEQSRASHHAKLCNAGSGPNSINAARNKVAGQRGFFADLYNSVASADSMIQLKSMISVMRTSNKWDMGCNTATAAKTFEMLDKLENVQHYCAIWRRILLFRFAEHRDKLLEEAYERRRMGNASLAPPHTRKAESEVIDGLVQEIYPYTAIENTHSDIHDWRETHGSERRKIKNRLHHARNWKRAVQQLQLGFFALVPIGGESGVQNTRHVDLPRFC